MADVLQCKWNIDSNCKKFYEKILQNKELLMKAKSSDIQER